MFETYAKGQRAVLEVQQRALSLGYHCCVPTVEARFDLVLVSDSGKMFRAQVKYADRVKGGGAVYLNLRKQTRNRGQAKPYLSSEIDVLLVYVPRMGEVLWIPPEVFSGRQSLSLRFENPKNGNFSNITDANAFIWRN
jgi:hypothetical protein